MLVRGLETLHEDESYRGYGMPRWDLEIADDTILLSPELKGL